MLSACLLRLDVNKTARGQWRSCVAPSHSKPSTLVSLGNSARFRLFGCALHDTSVCVKTCTAPSAHKSRTLMAQRKKGGGYRDGTLPLLPKSFGAHFSAPSPLPAASLTPELSSVADLRLPATPPPLACLRVEPAAAVLGSLGVLGRLSAARALLNIIIIQAVINNANDAHVDHVSCHVALGRTHRALSAVCSSDRPLTAAGSKEWSASARGNHRQSLLKLACMLVHAGLMVHCTDTYGPRHHG